MKRAEMRIRHGSLTFSLTAVSGQGSKAVSICISLLSDIAFPATSFEIVRLR